METLIIVIVVSLLLSAFFSGMEIAFLSSNKLRLEIERKQSKTYDRIAARFLNDPGQYISTILVGNNIALVIYSIFMSSLYVAVTGSSNYALETLISTLIIIFTAEFLPKAVVKANPNFYLRTFAVPLYGFYILFYPIARFTTGLSTLFLRILGRRVEATPAGGNFDKVDLASLVEEASADNTDKEQQEENEQRIRLFQNALDFSELRVRDCMVPRTDVEAIEVNESVDELRRLFVSTGYSRLPVYEGTIDHIIGYANLKSLFQHPQSIRSILRQALYVPETMPQQKLLDELTRTHKSLAIVIDEFGGTAGMVTLEDLLEQIFGEIEDEHDADYLVEKQVGEHEYILAGRLEIEHLNEAYDLHLPESERYDTLAGYILDQSEEIPKPGDCIYANGLKIKILRTSRTRIELVQVTKARAAGNEAS
ncbi:MAG TPA: hemolysin family protein [Candidatus Rikenella faecigallinarum]|uniref:Hemolysin family protein n=1 Tax=Candidatus Rikenella faecigallinarum TaxID=2838745 RepID=A0A9D1TYC2_9BACT|nr:hemolysin family protein [Candidatus Rikenella faecigallinarum]